MIESFNIETLGCKLNFAESDTISDELQKSGLNKVNDSADLHVLNTCSVTENADNKCKKRVRQIKKENPNARVVVVGCFAQLKPETIKEITGVDAVLTASEKFQIEKYLQPMQAPMRTEIAEVQDFVHAHSFESRTRSFLKVQDGCNYSCTFCTIPMARGGSRSPSIESIVKQAEELGLKGVKEIVLTGVNIGDYGIDLNLGRNERSQGSFIDLIKALDNVQSISRYRISSIEPNLLSDEIIEFVSNSRAFVPHFHIPLQSGSADILRGMKRRYKLELYEQRVRKIKTLMPNACIGADVIVGFPGETEEQFLETLNFIKDLPISYLHVFSYSERDNTLANEMDNTIPGATRKERRKRLQILSEKKRRAFYIENMGSEKTILLEESNRNGWLYGFTENYIRVKIPYNADLRNYLLEIELKGIDIDGLCLVTNSKEEIHLVES